MWSPARIERWQAAKVRKQKRRDARKALATNETRDWKGRAIVAVVFLSKVCEHGMAALVAHEVDAHGYATAFVVISLALMLLSRRE